MVLGQKVLVSGVVVLLCFMLIGQDDYRGESVLPLELLRPKYGEELCFPRDYVIGELGRGSASEESYRYARSLTANLAAGNGSTEALYFAEEKRLSVERRINALGARSWRVGGGRSEPDGAVSFLVRFLGREQSITGELYLRKAEPTTAAESAAQAAVVETAAVTAASAEKAVSADSALGAAEAVNSAASVNTALTAAESAETPPSAANTAAGAPANTAPSSVEEAPLWLVDDILLENPRGLAEGKYSPGGADMTPYERFF